MKIRQLELLTAVLIAASLGMILAPASRADDSGPQATADVDLLGAQWWQHAVSIPALQNPVIDATGANCGIGQRGDIWFLHGSFGNPLGQPIERQCTVPAGKTIFLPVVNWLCVPYPGETIAQNIAICKEINDLSDLRNLSIDGKVRNNLIRRRASAQAFALTAADDNILGYPTGVFAAVHDGYFAQLPLLKPGNHTVRLQGGVSAYGVTIDVLYHLNVVRPAATLPCIPGETC